MNPDEIILTKDQLLYEFVNQSNNTGFLTEDLVNIVKSDRENAWSNLSAAEFLVHFGLLENKQNLTRSNVRFEYSPLSQKTIVNVTKNNPHIIKKLNNFIEFKSLNPIAPYGASDKLFRSNGFFSSTIPKIKHAHLTHDISVVYVVSGFNPTSIKIYGLFSHDDMGIGQPQNINKQKSLAKQFVNQTFQTK
jgi:hypothetical protein